MAAVFVAPFENIAVSAAQDIYELATAATNSARVRRVKLSTNKTSSEQLRIGIYRYSGAPTSGSGGASPTVRKLSAGVGTNTVTVERNNTSGASGGTAELLHAEFWNAVTPFEWVPIDEKGFVELAASEHFVVRLEAAPGASIQMDGNVEWEEIG